ncbi:type II toxin-antitoxin system RelE/ParE family toxin [Glaciimonas sp. GG7]
MTRQVKVLDYAKIDYREIRKWVKMKFGENGWMEIKADFKKMLTQIGEMPFAGAITDEVTKLGLTDYRQRLVGKTRIIYQVKDHEVYVHMFVDTNRDFSTLLNARLTHGVQ